MSTTKQQDDSYGPHSVGQRLSAARLQRGLAQGDVARGAGLAPSYLSRIETGKVQPTFRTVMRIVRVLGADVSEIAGRETPEDAARGPCPVTERGQCLVDLIGAAGNSERYSPAEIRLLRRFAVWMKRAKADRVRAIELLLSDLSNATGED